MAAVVCLTAQTWGWTPVAPNEAVFFEDPKFKGASLVVEVRPGQRHRLVPDLGEFKNKISSLQVGEKVKVLVFTGPHFTGAVREYLDTIAGGMPDDDQICSLIVYPRGEPPQGVLLIQKRTSEVKKPATRPWNYITGQGMFFPLPESDQTPEARFPRIAVESESRARYISLSPAVAATLFDGPEFQGEALELPGRSNKTFFDLETMGFYHPSQPSASFSFSLTVRARDAQK